MGMLGAEESNAVPVVVRLLGCCRTSDQETRSFIPGRIDPSRVREAYLDLEFGAAILALRLHCQLGCRYRHRTQGS
jgi:hypothetical protein